MQYSLRILDARIYNDTNPATVGDEVPLTLVVVDATDDDDAKAKIAAELASKFGTDCVFSRDPIPPV